MAKRNALVLGAVQIGALLQKKVLLEFRAWRSTLLKVLAPIVVCLLLFSLQKVFEYYSNKEDATPDTYSLGLIPKATCSANIACHTMLYTGAGVAQVDKIVDYVALASKLDATADFVGLKSVKNTTRDLETVNDYILHNPNATQMAVVFTLSESDDVTKYTMVYNTTSTHYAEMAMRYRLAIDSAIAYVAVGKEASIDANFAQFPKVKPRIASLDIGSAVGGWWLVIPPMIVFFLNLIELVQDKENRARLGLRMVGLKPWAFWGSEYIWGIVEAALFALLTMAAGAAFQLCIFHGSNLLTLFLILFFFAYAVNSLAWFLSAVASRVSVAQTIGYVVILSSIVLQLILSSQNFMPVQLVYMKKAKWWLVLIRYILQMYPPFNFAKLWFQVSQRSCLSYDMNSGAVVQPTGFSWNDFMKQDYNGMLYGYDIHMSTPLSSVGFLVLNTVVFMVLGRYLDYVLPGEHGSPLPFYFMFTPSFWGFKSKKENDLSGAKAIVQKAVQTAEENHIDEDVVAEQQRALDISVNDDDVPLRIVGLKKTYRKYPFVESAKDVKALKQVTVTVDEGQLFCLLGHNGAGKTSMIQILTGLYDATAGYASVYGKSVNSDMEAVRGMTGVCPQHDILWNNLTAQEHLRMFAMLKGIPFSEISKQVRERLEDVGLTDVRNKRVDTFSGGMKRRLSVAIAAIGDPRIIFLDEPTTGMDPANRRAVWEMIERMKKGRVMLLTTHSMEEADILGDKIAIMASGELKVCANSTRLKSRFGSGFQVNAVTTEEKASDVIAEVSRVAKDAEVANNDAGSVSFVVPKEKNDQLIGLITAMETKKIPHVNDWGVTNTTLEDVFLKVTKAADFQYDQSTRSSRRVSTSIAEPPHGMTNMSVDPDADDATPENRSRTPQPTRKLTPRPFRAQFAKTIHLQKRQVGNNICQIATPLIALGLMLIIQLIVKTQAGNLTKTTTLTFDPVALNDNTPQKPFYADGAHKPGSCYEYFNVGKAAHVNGVGWLSKTNPDEGSGILSQLSQGRCVVKVEGELDQSLMPYTVNATAQDFTSLQTSTFNDLSALNSFALDDCQLWPKANDVPDGIMFFNELDVTDMRISYVASANTYENYERTIYNGPFYAVQKNFGSSQEVANTPDANHPYYSNQISIMDLIQTAFMRAIGVEHYEVSMQGMPYKTSVDIAEQLQNLVSLFFPIALAIQLPVYVYLIVLEKVERLREMMKSSGMPMWTYWTTYYVFDMTLYGLTAVVFYASCAAANVSLFRSTDPVLLILFLYGWGNAMIGMSFFISVFLNSTRAAVIVGYSIAVAGPVFALAILLIFNLLQMVPMWFFSLSPIFSFTYGVGLMNNACIAEKKCLSLFTMGATSEMAKCLYWLYGMGTFLVFFSVYLDVVVPQKFGVRRPPWFFISDLLKLVKGKKKAAEANDEMSTPLLGNDDEEGALVDADVLNEARRVQEKQYSPRCPAVATNLRKCYGSKVALKKLNLAVDEGECFGLLGPNGAGKTTFLSILTAVFPPTKGTATIAGYDVETETNSVLRSIGVTPQFDYLWSTLTVEEHLIFYCRLKGVPAKEEKEEVEKQLKSVGLEKFRGRFAGRLSGGMKRRLSIAISLIGDPRIIFLDEPTTGLDPVSRRHLWSIINNSKRGRAIIITTHGMDEAEVLCSRIGIFAGGELKCIGNQQHLKNKFAGGYNITLNYRAGTHDAIRFVQELLPSARISSSYPGTCTFEVTGSNIVVSEIFRNIEERREEVGIVDWGISQRSLDDVFMRIIRESTPESEGEDDQPPSQ